MDIPADKFARNVTVRQRLHTINNIGACFFDPIHYKPATTHTGDPHYTDAERSELARLCSRDMRARVPDLPRL